VGNSRFSSQIVSNQSKIWQIAENQNNWPVFFGGKLKHPSSVRVMAACVVGVESSSLEYYTYDSCAIDPSKRELIMELYSAWKKAFLETSRF